MRMTFFWTTDLGEFFFPGLNVKGVGPLALVCLVVGVASILYEAIKVHSASVRARAAREQIAAVSCAPSETANLLLTDQSRQTSFSKKFCKLLSEAIVFLCHNSIGYAIMLSCMVYSGWLFLAVVLSMGLGYFLFGHISMKINMENVQARTNTVICSPACPETGASNDTSKNASPCRSISEQINQQQQPGSSASTTMPSTVTVVAAIPACCQPENQAVPTAQNETGDSCCRL